VESGDEVTPGKYDLGDYKEVSERIIDLRQKYPDASLQSEVILWPTQELPFIAVKAECYRTRKDENPGVGLAWEPFPGKTPYTKDSELQNAETSAWGRAIVAALASDTKQGIASADEVRARRSDTAGSGVSSPGPAPSSGGGESAYSTTKEVSGEGPASEGVAGQTPSASPPDATSGPDGGIGEGASSGPATPEQRTRLLQVYKKPSAAKAKAVELFGRPPTMILTDLTSAEVEALILEAAS
jgi:hypothetical protein